MPNYVHEVGRATRVTATALAVGVVSSGPVNLIGVMIADTITSNFVQLFTQTAASITGAPIVGTMSMARNTFYAIPAALPLGLTYAVTNDDADLTIFWNPAGGV